MAVHHLNHVSIVDGFLGSVSILYDKSLHSVFFQPCYCMYFDLCQTDRFLFSVITLQKDVVCVLSVTLLCTHFNLAYRTAVLSCSCVRITSYIVGKAGKEHTYIMYCTYAHMHKFTHILVCFAYPDIRRVFVCRFPNSQLQIVMYKESSRSYCLIYTEAPPTLF